MIASITKLVKFRRTVPIVFGILLLVLVQMTVSAQENPPKPITVTVSTYQNLNFGTFCYGNGSGTRVIIDPSGSRSSTGNIILISSSFSAALYNIESIPGTIVTIVNGPDAILTGSNGGTLTLHIGDSYPQSPLITTGVNTPVTIGGTLYIGTSAANPPGMYSGTFSVTFIQQ